MFDPKITKGKWEIDKEKCGKLIEFEEDAHYSIARGDPSNNSWVTSPHEDAIAISAVPELLAIYKAARNINGLEGKLMRVNKDGSEDYEICDKLYKLSKAIKHLEDMHCK